LLWTVVCRCWVSDWFLPLVGLVFQLRGSLVVLAGSAGGGCLD
jgi:hypothetical protein